MTGGLPRLPEPTAGPEAPLQMLSACRGRVERQCATLRRLVPHLAAQGADAQARTAASNGAARLLSEDELARIARAMRERRGIGER